MDKSSKEIDAQLKRVIALANELGGKYLENAKHKVDTQYFAQIARRAKAQHGIKIFGTDPDERRPFVFQEEPKKVQAAVVQIVREAQKPTPTEKAKNMMSFTAWMDSSKENRKKIQDGARHAFIRKMYAELLTDYTVCQLEGWDMFEFPRMLRDALAVCFPKQPKQLTLF